MATSKTSNAGVNLDALDAPDTAVAAPKASTKGEHISATIDADQHAALSDIRFAKRHDRLSDTVREAIAKYNATEGK